MSDQVNNSPFYYLYNGNNNNNKNNNNQQQQQQNKKNQKKNNKPAPSPSPSPSTTTTSWRLFSMLTKGAAALTRQYYKFFAQSIFEIQQWNTLKPKNNTGGASYTVTSIEDELSQLATQLYSQNNIDYYNQTDGRVIKAVTLGNSGVGKSTLLRRCGFEDGAKYLEEPVSNIGVDFVCCLTHNNKGLFIYSHITCGAGYFCCCCCYYY